ncbi:hypothetical protein ACHAW5_005822 [Stephanodiscus triporus]|uniref:SAYSvFN domain-containing protein n=1 Tax=Stephanodiscus triporus TaxID=2934178 RepID=A0ABD3PXI5_9STRA
MPPPPPNFLPANRRRRLDPSRRLRSRELWNEVRFHASSSSSSSSSSDDDHGRRAARSRTAMAHTLLRALAYEFQPFRILPFVDRVSSFVRDHYNYYYDDGEAGLRKLVSSSSIRVVSAIRIVANRATVLSSSTVRRVDRSIVVRSIATLATLYVYRRALLYLHDLLAIGPLVVITTLLILLYTIGLGENTGAAGGVPSAYSVFNRGMKRLLGTVDGEALAHLEVRREMQRQRRAAAAMGFGAGDIIPAFDDDDGNLEARMALLE